MSESLLRETFEAGVTIIKEGDAGNVFYMVEEGQVDVNSGGNFIRTMEPGAFFGEQALLNNEPRTATCVAKSQCTLLVMDRENFETLFGPLKVRVRLPAGCSFAGLIVYMRSLFCTCAHVIVCTH